MIWFSGSLDCWLYFVPRSQMTSIFYLGRSKLSQQCRGLVDLLQAPRSKKRPEQMLCSATYANYFRSKSLFELFTAVPTGNNVLMLLRELKLQIEGGSFLECILIHKGTKNVGCGALEWGWGRGLNHFRKNVKRPFTCFPPPHTWILVCSDAAYVLV